VDKRCPEEIQADKGRPAYELSPTQPSPEGNNE